MKYNKLEMLIQPCAGMSLNMRAKNSRSSYVSTRDRASFIGKQSQPIFITRCSKMCFHCTPLGNAFKKGCVDIFSYPIEIGADVNEENTQGETVIFYAAQEKIIQRFPYIQMLAEHDADLNHKNKV